MSSDFDLTPEERAELEARPIGCPDWRNLTEEQIATRVEIAKKVVAHGLKNDPTIEDWARRAYLKCPVWGFYEDAESTWPPRRVFGVCLDSDGVECVHNITLLSLFSNRTIGGTPIAALKRVDRWSPETIERMRSPLYRGTGLFEDPLAFLVLSD